jgi:ABC-2 type transport system permease protein
MLMFWTVEAMGINFLRIQVQSLSRWPEFIYRGFANRLFTVGFPILLVGSAPVYFLLDHGRWLWVLAAVGALLVTWGLIGVFWQKGLKAYESASS